MPRLELAGRYNGKIVSSKVDQTNNGLWQFVVCVVLVARYNAESQQAEPLPEPITEYAYLMLEGVDKEGNGQTYRNDTQVKAIKGFAPEWDGESLETLHAMNLSGREVSVKADANTYNDKTTVRISFINGIGGMRETAPEIIKAMGSGWSSRKPIARPKPDDDKIV